MPDADGILEARDSVELTKDSPTRKRHKMIKGSEHMDWGMRNRMSQLIKKDGHCFFLPIDHGYFQGPTRCLEKPGETVKDLLAYSDALFVTRGVLRSAIDPDRSIPVILRVSGGTSVIGHDLSDEIITTAIDDIIRLNASAVGVSVFIGTDYEKQSLDNLSKMVNECERYGIPVMAVTAVGKELEKGKRATSRCAAGLWRSLGRRW